MLNKCVKSNCMTSFVVALFGFISIVIGGLLSQYNHFYSGGYLALTAVVMYFFIVLKLARKNWLDIRAIFTGIWLFTIGLATLKLAGYQKEWIFNTWILLALAYVMFYLGATTGIHLGYNAKNPFEKITKVFKNVDFKMNNNRLFYICVITTLLGFICFLINVKIKGFIPAFSENTKAYVEFYTKFHVFAVASTAVSGLCYYLIKTQPIGLLKKSILWLCIFYMVILFPILVVSRGVFIVASLSLATVIFYLNGRKLWVFVLCLGLIGSIYMFTSNLRGYSNEQLTQIFRPADITIETNKPSDDNQNTTDNNIGDDIVIDDNQNTTDDSQTETNDNQNTTNEETEDKKESLTFTLPPKLAFLYTYLTVSHDNFNEAIVNLKGYTFGARQLFPFNIILRNKFISDTIANGEFYQITVNFNTVNMVGLFYYDFHLFGIVVCTFIWSCFFGFIQGLYEKRENIFLLCILGLIVNSVSLAFFSSWVDNFEIWMFAGVILIVSMITSISFKSKNTN